MRHYGDIAERVEAFGRFTDECWEWTGCLSTTGYGRVRIGGKTGYVHRLVVEWAQGITLARNDYVDHLCRNTTCFRPSHLEVVEPAENTRRGITAKLSPEDVRRIHQDRRAGLSIKQLAQEHNVSTSHVSRVLRGLRYDLNLDKHEHAKNARQTRHARKAHRELFE